MQRDILIFQNPVIVKGHNIFSLITPKATHVNKARERVKEISEFRQLHDRFKGEAVDGCHAAAPEQRAPCRASSATLPGTRPLRPQPPGVCATHAPPGHDGAFAGALTAAERSSQSYAETKTRRLSQQKKPLWSVGLTCTGHEASPN